MNYKTWIGVGIFIALFAAETTLMAIALHSGILVALGIWAGTLIVIGMIILAAYLLGCD